MAGTSKVIVPEYTLQWSDLTWRIVFHPGHFKSDVDKLEYVQVGQEDNEWPRNYTL